MIRNLLLASSLLWAQPPSAAPAPARVEGVVVNSVTNRPAPRAAVLLRAPSEESMSYAVVANDKGEFAMNDVAPGVYTISAEPPNMAFTYQVLAAIAPQPLVLTAGQTVKEVVKLTPRGAVMGRVLDQDGDPVRGAEVFAVQPLSLDGGTQLRRAGYSKSNDNGDYRLFGLRPGRYYVQVAVSQAPRTSLQIGETLKGGHPPEGYPPAFFPAAADLTLAKFLDVAPGAELRGIDISLRRTAYYNVRGKLTDPQTPSSAPVLLPLNRELDPLNRSAPRIANGTFEFNNVAPGSYLLVHSHADGGKKMYARHQVDVVNRDVEGIALTLAPGGEMRGVVRMEGDAPKLPEGLSVFLQPLMLSRFPSVSGPVQPDGTFALHDIPPDFFRVSVRMPPSMYVKSVHLEGHDVSGKLIDLTQSAGSLAISLRADIGQLSGLARAPGGEPAIHVRVTLIPYGPTAGRPDFSRSTLTDDKGNFSITSVAPGEYKLFAWENVDLAGIQDPEFRKPFEKAGVPIKMEPRGKQTLDVTIIPVSAMNTASQ